MADHVDPRPGLALIVFAGGYDRVHYALAMASAAAAINRPVILFFSGRALWTLVDGDGWKALDFAESGTSADSRDAVLAHRGVATLPELLDACRELNVRFIACEMGWRALGLEQPRLRAELRVETAGLVTLMTATGPGWQTLFV
jgi:peroxiredoxin family protein